MSFTVRIKCKKRRRGLATILGIKMDADRWKMMKNYNIFKLKIKNESLEEITKD